MPVTVTVRGGPETARALSTLGRQSTQAKVLRQSLRPGAALMRKEARSRAPVATGLYRRSIAIAIQRTRGASARLRVGVRGSRARIAHLLEFGTRYMPAQPHLRPAAQQSADESVRLFGREIWARISAEARRIALRRFRRRVR